jgi:chromosome partitioning protein
MRTICYASWKGGTGKTLLAFNTIERAHSTGLRVLGCDFDEQRMLSRQCAVRNRNAPSIDDLNVVEGHLTMEGIEALIDVQQANEYDLIVCDLPGTDSFVMDRALNIMDAILIPVNGAPYEILNTARMTQRVSQKGWNAFLIPNNVPPTQKRKNETADTVGQMGAPISPVAIVRRIVHWDAGMVGLTVNEFAPASPAAAEIREYWAWLQGALGISRNSFPSAKELAYA